TEESGIPITFYRPINDLAYGAGFYFNFNDSENEEQTYGFEYVSIEDNTADAIRGDYNIQLAVEGEMGIRFRVFTAGSGGVYLGNNQYLKLIADGLTAEREIGFPDEDTTLVGTNDSRLSNARTPTAHASSHQSGGSDAIKLDDLATP